LLIFSNDTYCRRRGYHVRTTTDGFIRLPLDTTFFLSRSLAFYARPDRVRCDPHSATAFASRKASRSLTMSPSTCKLQRDIVSSLPLYNYTSNSVLLVADRFKKTHRFFTPADRSRWSRDSQGIGLSLMTGSREVIVCPFRWSQPLLRCPKPRQGYFGRRYMPVWFASAPHHHVSRLVPASRDERGWQDRVGSAALSTRCTGTPPGGNVRKLVIARSRVHERITTEPADRPAAFSR